MGQYYYTEISFKNTCQWVSDALECALSRHHEREKLNHDLTAPLTVPVAEGEAFLLDHLRTARNLSPKEQQDIDEVVQRHLSMLLEELPPGTPEGLIDRICELGQSAESLLKIPTGKG